jgi:hypothetical protein
MEYDNRILTSANKVRTAWMIVNSETGRNTNRKSGIQSLNVDGNNTENQQIIADALNEHCINIGDKIKTSRHVNHKHINIKDIDIDTFANFMNQAFCEPFPSIEHKRTTTKEIERIIKSLESKNTSGCDDISTIVLKSCSSLISFPLNYTCNRSLSTVFPDRLKYAIIKPLYKNGSKQDISNGQE